ncbi:MAG: hypothetical protein ACREC0_12260 [Methylocella sp.]
MTPSILALADLAGLRGRLKEAQTEAQMMEAQMQEAQIGAASAKADKRSPSAAA